MGHDRRRVGEAVDQLKEWGALSIDGDLTTRRGYYTGQLEWSNAPVIELAEQYRGQQDEHQLGDVICGSLTTP